jgi:hypothetical protein
VGVHRIGAVEVRLGAGATAGLVVLMTVVAEGEVVHRPWAAAMTPSGP